MPLPEFNESGDLPAGIYETTLTEIVARFGSGTSQRKAVTARLVRIHGLAAGTGALDRFLLFGSYVTDKPEPNDVDVVLIMRDDFDLKACPPEALALFDHRRAEHELGASVFWARPGMLFLEALDEFIAHWQIKRDNTRRGIVEVKE